MTQVPAGRLILFEPWSLGDVLIASSVLRELTVSTALACHPAWHSILRGAFGEKSNLQLIPVDLPYTTRNRTNSFDSAGIGARSDTRNSDLILSIRGDARDYLAARKLFPGARIRMKGWIRFFGRKSALINAPFARDVLRVQNRYHSWAHLGGLPFSDVERTYAGLRAQAPRTGRIAIHLGAQWRSKQFPHVASLRDALIASGWEVVLLAGPSDALPPAILEESVTRAADLDLIAQLRAAEHVITNDSGPMHLAAFLGCRTVALARTSPIEEWRPPATTIISSARIPRGYRPHPRYMSDESLSDWPSVSTIIEGLNASIPKTAADFNRKATSLAG